MSVHDAPGGQPEPAAQTDPGTRPDPGGQPEPAAQTDPGTRPDSGAQPKQGAQAEQGGQPERGGESMTVEIGGTSRRLPVEHDYTGDGRPDAAVETPDGTVIVFADTEDNETGAAGPDGRADQAYMIDKRTGQVVGTAHLDLASSTWVDAEGRPVGAPTARRSMTVQTAAGDQQLPAEHDYTGDGRPDASVETPDGRVVVYSDTEDNETGAAEPDGRADEAWIVDKSTGRAVGEAHVEPGSGGWVDGSAGSGGGSR